MNVKFTATIAKKVRSKLHLCRVERIVFTTIEYMGIVKEVMAKDVYNRIRSTINIIRSTLEFDEIRYEKYTNWHRLEVVDNKHLLRSLNSLLLLVIEQVSCWRSRIWTIVATRVNALLREQQRYFSRKDVNVGVMGKETLRHCWLWEGANEKRWLGTMR